MKLDLCKLLGVEEGEEFKITNSDFKYVIRNNRLKRIFNNLDEVESNMGINDLSKVKIIKLPKKKEFTDDELCILRNVDKEYKWVARDKCGNISLYEKKPYKSITMVWSIEKGYNEWFFMFDHLFNSIQWEDEEPVFIDDYVER